MADKLIELAKQLGCHLVAYDFQARASPWLLREPLRLSAGAGRVNSMIDHFGIQVDDLAAARAFYDRVLEPLGYGVVMDVGPALGYGEAEGHPMFWIGTATDPIPNRQSHIAFAAPSRAAVAAFHERAVSAGSESLHEPRIWPEYHPGYFGAFVRDPDGNNVEAVHHTFPGADAG